MRTISGFFSPFYQLDIKDAFHHGELAEDVYIKQPSRLVAQAETLSVHRLEPISYGLKQSPRAEFGFSALLSNNLAYLGVKLITLHFISTLTMSNVYSL